jgi:hypothetical protein
VTGVQTCALPIWPYALAREVIATSVTRRAEPALRADGDWRGPEALSLRAAAADGEPARARAALAQLAAEARARGVLRARAQRSSTDARPPWAESVLGVGPWSPELGEDAVRHLAAFILSRLDESGATGAALGWGDAAIHDE